MKQIALWGVLPLVFLGAVFSGCTGSRPEEPGEGANTLPQARNVVDTAHIKRQTFQREVMSNGIVHAFQQARLAFKAGGPLMQVQVKEGQHVEKGSVVALLDTTASAAAVRKARQGLARARVNMQDMLVGQGYNPSDTSAIPVDIRRIARLKSGLAEARIQFSQARKKHRQAVLRAPFSGRVADVTFRPHEHIAPGETFCRLLGNRKYNIRFNVLETELERIRRHQPVQVLPLAGGQVRGRITAINPAVDKHGMVQVTANITQPGQALMDGMHARVRVHEPLPNKLVIPKKALVLRQNKQVVFTLKNDSIAMWNYVKTGEENSQAYTIKEGLKAGDAVITHGNINLAHETIVEVEK